MFAFYLIALFFAVVALFAGLLALCSRLGGYLSGLTTAVALFFQTLAAALMTYVFPSSQKPDFGTSLTPHSAWTVQGRNHFHNNGQGAKLGVKLYAFTWTAMACFLLATVMFCMSGALGRDRNGTPKRNRSVRTNKSANRGSFFSTRSSRKSKDDYAV